MPHQYADLTNLLADYLPDAKRASEQEAIGRVLDAVSFFVDNYCRRSIGYFLPAGEEGTVKRIYGEGERFLRLPVHVFGSVESVTLNGTEIDSSLWYESDKSGWIYLENNNYLPENSFDFASDTRFYSGLIYRVTARWGYAETPADLSEAVRQTVERVWVTQRGFLGQLSPSGFIVERAMPVLAKEILDKYKRREFEI